MAESGASLFNLALAQAQNQAQTDTFGSLFGSLATGLEAGINAQMEAELKKQAQQQEFETLQGLFNAVQGTELKTSVGEANKLDTDKAALKTRGGTKINRTKAVLGVMSGKSAAGAVLGAIEGPTEEKARFELGQKIRGEKEVADRRSLIDGFIGGSVTSQEFFDKAPELGITNKEIRDALEISKTAQAQRGQVIPSQSNLNINPTVDGTITSSQDSGFEVTEIDPVTNLPTKISRKKKSAAQEKRDVENNELASQARVATNLFIKARAEVGDIPNIGERGIKGRAAGLFAQAKAIIGESPQLKVFQDNIGKFATLEAKASGEQRPTDQDIVRFIAPLVGITGNDEENAIKIETQLDLLDSKGVSVGWARELVQEFERVTGQVVDFQFDGGAMTTPSGVTFSFERLD